MFIQVIRCEPANETHIIQCELNFSVHIQNCQVSSGIKFRGHQACGGFNTGLGSIFEQLFANCICAHDTD